MTVSHLGVQRIYIPKSIEKICIFSVPVTVFVWE